MVDFSWISRGFLVEFPHIISRFSVVPAPDGCCGHRCVSPSFPAGEQIAKEAKERRGRWGQKAAREARSREEPGKEGAGAEDTGGAGEDRTGRPCSLLPEVKRLSVLYVANCIVAAVTLPWSAFNGELEGSATPERDSRSLLVVKLGTRAELSVSRGSGA